MSVRAEVVGDVVCELGESPLWMPAAGELAWVDILRRRLHRLHVADGRVTTVAPASVVTALGLSTGDELIAATRSGFGWLEPRTGAVTAIGAPLVDDQGDRMNDGAVAPDGSFWAGSCVPEARTGTGALWRLRAPETVEPLLDGVTISNGLDWFGDDERSMLYVDSPSGGVDHLTLREDGTIESRRRFVDVDPSDGQPDGLSIDEDGHAWVAIWGAGEVRGYDRSGRLQEVVALPAKQPSSCAFGDEDRRTLFITSAREDLAQPGPFDGRLYACRLAQRGQAPRRFRGNGA